MIAAFSMTAVLVGCSNDSDPSVIGSDTSSQNESDASGTGGDAAKSDSATKARDFEVESGFTTSVDSIGTRYVSAGARLTNPNADLGAETKTCNGKAGQPAKQPDRDVSIIPTKSQTHRPLFDTTHLALG
jgi:hypothetical protein